MFWKGCGKTRRGEQNEYRDDTSGHPGYRADGEIANMKKLLWGLLLLVSALAHSTLAGAASVVLGQAGAGGVSAIITPDPGEIGRPATIWMGGVLNCTLFLRDGPSTWVQYLGGPLPIALTRAAL